MNCFSSPSGPVKDRPCSRAIRTSSLAASSSAEGSGFVFFGTISSVVITAPSPLTLSQRVGPETPLTGQSRRPPKVAQCGLATRYVTIKHRYQLGVDTSEKAALRQMLATCTA